MCKENNTPFALASAISLAANSFNALMLITEVSITSPANKGAYPFKSLPLNVILYSVAFSMVADFSEP
jgi:hypothetical protein